MYKLDGPITKRSAYRQRVFRLPDNTIELVLGDSTQPSEWILLADHDVVQVSVVSDHVEPVPVDPAPPADPAAEPSV